ncbi:putative WRKY transcription factor 19 [Vitis vinifera]|uniref:Putative WRKY transcription factor 19 n=1 Tax=Vitis vinifera TaxID=29760 RepID=A0A438IE84_VITVI|nr:putative WRKY transcription factor 19 [Vitis vinifera]
MHDLIQEMGMEIVRQQSLQELGKRSRLWFHEDIFDVLKKNTGSEKIEGIFLNLFHLQETIDFTTQVFAGMSKLRLLKVYQSDKISRNSEDTFKKENFKVRFSSNFKFCYEELRYLDLYGYSLKSLPNYFNAKNLVHLNMPCSHIKQLWKGIKVPEKLKCMDLSHSKYLIETPNLSRVTNLEQMIQMSLPMDLYRTRKLLENPRVGRVWKVLEMPGDIHTTLHYGGRHERSPLPSREFQRSLVYS